MLDNRGIWPLRIMIYTRSIPLTNQIEGIFAILKLGASSLLNEETDARGIWHLIERIDTRGIWILSEEVDTKSISPF